MFWDSGHVSKLVFQELRNIIELTQISLINMCTNYFIYNWDSFFAVSINCTVKYV